MWCRPRGPMPGGDGAGPLASKGPTSATGGSVDLGPRGRQSNATGRTTPPVTALRVVQWNAEGIRQGENPQSYKPSYIDVICIQETHLKEECIFFVRGYDIFRRDRPTGVKGGILTLVKHGIPAVLTSQSPDGDLDLEFVTTKIFLQSEELLITNVYSSPSKRLNLHTIQPSTEKHLIVGDFNGHSPAWGYDSTDDRGEEIQDWMMDNQLVLINKPDDKPSYYSRAWKKTSTPDLALEAGHQGCRQPTGWK